jgi:hypothetical protein
MKYLRVPNKSVYISAPSTLWEKIENRLGLFRAEKTRQIDVANSRQKRRRKKEITAKLEKLIGLVNKDYLFDSWLDLDAWPEGFQAVRDAEDAVEKAIEILE